MADDGDLPKPVHPDELRQKQLLLEKHERDKRTAELAADIVKKESDAIRAKAQDEYHREYDPQRIESIIKIAAQKKAEYVTQFRIHGHTEPQASDFVPEAIKEVDAQEVGKDNRQQEQPEAKALHPDAEAARLCGLGSRQPGPKGTPNALKKQKNC